MTPEASKSSVCCAVGREMQIREQHLAAAKLLALGGERLLDLHDQFGATEDGIGVCDDLGAGCAIIGVRQTCADAGIRLHQDAMALVGQFAHRRGHEADAVLVVFYFLGDADQHGGQSLFAARSSYIT